MSVFVVAHLTFVDVDRYRRYQSHFAGVFRKFRGELLVADEQPILLEGSDQIDKVVIMEFPDAEEARRMMESPEYREISLDREAGANTHSVMVRSLGAT